MTTLVLLHRHIQKRSQRQLRSSLRRHTSQRPDQQEQLEGCWQPARASAVRAQQERLLLQGAGWPVRRAQAAYRVLVQDALRGGNQHCYLRRMANRWVRDRAPSARQHTWYTYKLPSAEATCAAAVCGGYPRSPLCCMAACQDHSRRRQTYKPATSWSCMGDSATCAREGCCNHIYK